MEFTSDEYEKKAIDSMTITSRTDSELHAKLRQANAYATLCLMAIIRETRERIA